MEGDLSSFGIGGYYDFQTRQCVPYPSPKKADENPAIKTTAPKAKEKPNNNFQIFGNYGISGAVGCGYNSPPPLCETNSNPQILSLLFVDSEGNLISTNPKPGDRLTLMIDAETCAENKDNLLVQVKIDNQNFETVSVDPNSGLYLYNFTVPSTLGSMPLKITVRVEDTERKSVTQNTIDLYISSPPPISAKYIVTYHQDGAIPFRPVNFEAVLINAPDDTSAYEYNWIITYHNNQPYSGEQPPSGASTYFAFPQSGIYLVKLEVTKNGELVAEKTESVEIYPFPNPEVKISINDNQPAYVGNDVTINGIIERDWPEDQSATYNWKVVHIASGTPVVCGDEGNRCAFTVNQSGTYLITLTVTGHSNGVPAYTKSVTETMEAYLATEQTLSADYSIVVPPEGAIVHRDIQFIGALAEEETENYQFRWTIVLRNGKPYPPDAEQPAHGQITTYKFTQPGIYAMRLDITKGDTLVASKLKSFEIYPFPIPDIAIDLNGNQPIYTNDEVTLIGIINRNWPEDLGATYNWEIRRVEANPENPNAVAETTITSGDGQTMKLQFTIPGTYKVILTVTGKDGTYTKTKTEFVSVYEP